MVNGGLATAFRLMDVTVRGIFVVRAVTDVVIRDAKCRILELSSDHRIVIHRLRHTHWKTRGVELSNTVMTFAV